MSFQERNSMLATYPNQKNSLRFISHFVLVSFLTGIFLFNLPLPVGFRSQAQASAPPIETGKFRLHKFQQAIGEESYEITRDGDVLLMKSEFKFTDRGSPSRVIS